jgi:hypothetical protein
VRGLVRGRGDDLRIERAVLVGDAGIEGDAGLIAVAGVDVAERPAVAAGLIILPVRR